MKIYFVFSGGGKDRLKLLHKRNANILFYYHYLNTSPHGDIDRFDDHIEFLKDREESER